MALLYALRENLRASQAHAQEQLFFNVQLIKNTLLNQPLSTPRKKFLQHCTTCVRLGFRDDRTWFSRTKATFAWLHSCREFSTGRAAAQPQPARMGPWAGFLEQLPSACRNSLPKSCRRFAGLTGQRSIIVKPSWIAAQYDESSAFCSVQ
jgi:hypothetical protein